MTATEKETVAQRDSDTALLDKIFEPFNRSDAPGLVVGVARCGQSVYRKAFGLASVQQAVANTVKTRMRIGSTSKHFTCLAALLLAEEGQLDLDAPASRYLAELNAHPDSLTLRHFMNHSSGFRCSLEMSGIANGSAFHPEGWELQALARQRETNFPVGQGQMYCNGGYHLLSIAIERAAGVPFETFLQQRIFAPLGMVDTQSVGSDVRIVPGLADLHVSDGKGGWRRGMLPSEELLGEGAIVSTIDDMLLWLAHMNGVKRVGSAESWRQLLAPLTLGNGRDSVYALGLFRHDYRGVELIHHGGSVAGGNSQMLTVPSHGLDIVIHNNGALVSVQQLARDIIDALLENQLASSSPPLPSLERYRHLVGTKYHSNSDGVMIGFGELPDGKLGLSFMNNVPMPIIRERGPMMSAVFEEVAIGPIEFNTDDLAPSEDGQAPPTLRYLETGHETLLQRMPASPPPLSEAGAGLVGRFHSHDLGADAEFAFEGETLVMRLRGEYSGWRRHLIQAHSDTAFGVSGEGPTGAMMALTAERDAGGGIQVLRIDGLRARHLKFERIEANA